MVFQKNNKGTSALHRGLRDFVLWECDGAGYIGVWEINALQKNRKLHDFFCTNTGEKAAGDAEAGQ